MIDDAMAGEIDLIITKSISRFARNTEDCLNTIRELREKNVPVIFEKKNIWTFDSKGELLISIMSSLAQEESRSISQNTRVAQDQDEYRKREADIRQKFNAAKAKYDECGDEIQVAAASRKAVRTMMPSSRAGRGPSRSLTRPSGAGW